LHRGLFKFNPFQGFGIKKSEGLEYESKIGEANILQLAEQPEAKE
jgi:hypothetical protein